MSEILRYEYMTWPVVICWLRYHKIDRAKYFDMSLLWDRTLNALNELFRWTAKEENTFTKWIDVWLRIFNQRAPIDVALMLKHSYIWTWCICFGVFFLKADQMLNSFTQCRTNSFFSLLFYYYFKFVICFFHAVFFSLLLHLFILSPDIFGVYFICECAIALCLFFF